jgi:adenine-specific DNA-methyltransferase
MTKIVFISGSRSVKELPQSALNSLDKIIELGFKVILGDCYGVDTLVQKYLKSKNYTKVTVYHIGNYPRFNLGFKTVKVDGIRQVDKDIEMSKKAHYGLAIWDGKSKGTLANIQRVPLTKVIQV